MVDFTSESFVATLALIGAVIIISALCSGLIEKTGLPQVAVFLGLGAALGPAGLDLLKVELDSPILRIVATLSLTLVLFTDALTIDLKEVRKHSKLTLILLGPGTLLSAAIISAVGWGLLGLPIAAAVILGAALSSTDPVILRGLLRLKEITPATRQGLRLESGLNDVVLLPIIFVAMAFLAPAKEGGGKDWMKLLIDMLILGPGAGIAIGLLAVATLDMVRRRMGVRRDYEALYSLGVALAAFAAAEAVHGSGFLSAFAAGLTISALDVELCDCFLEYGETTAEMALLFTFVLFGSSLIWTGFGVAEFAVIAFAILAILARPLAFFPSLWLSQVDRKSRWLISWLGPRGLSSLLLVLLPVFEKLPGSQRLFSICCLVVILSIVLHGGISPVLISRMGRKSNSKGTPPPPSGAVGSAITAVAAPHPMPLILHEKQPEKAASKPASLSDNPDGDDSAGQDRITLEAFQRLQEVGTPVVVLDVRTRRTWEDSTRLAKGAIRVEPENVILQMNKLAIPKSAIIAAYCT